MGGLPVTFYAFASLAEALASLALAAGVVFWTVVNLKMRGTQRDWIASFQNMHAAFDYMNDAFQNMQKTLTHQQADLNNVVSWTIPSEEWRDVIELHQQIWTFNGQGKLSYVIYCQQNGGFWKVGDHGYTQDVSEAKRFTAAEGLILVLDRSRNGVPADCYTLVAVPKEG